MKLREFIELFAGDYAQLNLLSDDGTQYATYDISPDTATTKAIDSYWINSDINYWYYEGDQLFVSTTADGVSASRSAKSRKPVKSARVYRDGLGGYQPWSGAVDTWNKLEEYDKIDVLEQMLDEAYYDEGAGEGVINETELNDLLWFEPETVCEWVGLYYNDETGEISDEPFGESEEE